MDAWQLRSMWIGICGVLLLSIPAAINASTLVPRKYQPVPLGKTVPYGWMRAQLQAQNKGMCGNNWLGAGGHTNDSSWVGGHGYNGLAESWVYWANGAIPMHVQLNNTDGIAELRTQIDYILAQAKMHGGWLGPLVDGSPWSSFRGATCLTQWAEAFPDTYGSKVKSALVTYASRLGSYLQKTPLATGSWSQMRWQEGAAALQWLLDNAALTPAQTAAVSSTIDILSKQGMDWDRWVHSDEQHPFVHWNTTTAPRGPYMVGRDMVGGDLRSERLPDKSTYLDCERLCNSTPGCVAYVWANCDNVDPRDSTLCYLKAHVGGISNNKCRNSRVTGGTSGSPPGFAGWFPNNTEDADHIGTNGWKPVMDRMWTHGVNLGQALNTWGVMYRQSKDDSWVTRGRSGWDKIMSMHGQATGVMSGDETLAGLPPDRGSETCLVVETLNSASEMFLTTGDVWYADRAERIAYNALPGAFLNGSMWSLNYFQQVNKLDAIDRCESGCTYCYGMVYECCASNHAQGWPKFSARMLATVPPATPGGAVGVAVVYYFSAVTKALELADGNVVTLDVSGAYPFRNGVITVNTIAKKAFPLSMRVPAFTDEPTSSVRLYADGSIHTLPGVTAGSMYTTTIPAGTSTLTLTLGMRVKVERRPPYQLSKVTQWASNAANIMRGPLLYALPLKYVLDSKNHYDDRANLLPANQPHGQNNYLLLDGNWTYAILLADDANPEANLQHVANQDMPLPLGQGPFAAALVADSVLAKAVLVPPTDWTSVKQGRGADKVCEKGTSISPYVCRWAAPSPPSPVSNLSHLPTIPVTLLPYGATDLRVAEFPTFEG